MPTPKPADSQTQEQQHTPPAQEEKKSNLLSNILTIIGFAIIFIIVIWGLVHIVSLSGSWFSSLFYKPAPTIQVTAPSTVNAGTPVNVSWKYTTTEKGTYAFVYQCKNGVAFAAQGATSTYIGVPCGVAYTIPSATSAVSVVPLLAPGASSTPETVSIVFIPSTGSQVLGNANMTINPPQIAIVTKPTSTPSTPKPTSYTIPQPRVASPADLAVHIISQNVLPDGSGSVTFDIANIGGSTSGSYYFSAVLPTEQPYPYQSAPQAPLSPGSHVVSTLHFTDLAPGGGTFSVSIDGGDGSYGDNYASTQIVAPYNTYNSYNPYNNYDYNQAPYTQYPVYNY